VQVFIEKVYAAKIFNDIYKMLFRRSFFTRVLSACDFDQEVAFKSIIQYVQWR